MYCMNITVETDENVLMYLLQEPNYNVLWKLMQLLLAVSM